MKTACVCNVLLALDPQNVAVCAEACAHDNPALGQQARHKVIDLHNLHCISKEQPPLPPHTHKYVQAPMSLQAVHAMANTHTAAWVMEVAVPG